MDISDPLSPHCPLLLVTSHCYIVIYIIIQHHSDTISKTDAWINDAWRNEAGRLLYNYILFLSLLQGFKRVVQGLHVRGCWRPNINFIFWPHCYDRHVVSFLFSCCLTGGLGLTLSGVSESPLGRVWPSLPHLVSSCLEFCWQLLWHPTQLNYIIIQPPHDRPLDLWNRMFNCHQAEITVMQFRGYSLLVHHCSGTMGPSPCPIS